jgi:hypothetical protein
MSLRAHAKRIAVFDLETDPFLHGRLPQAFAAGYQSATDAEPATFWGEHNDCIPMLLAHIAADQRAHGPVVCYAHNLGRFDLFFLLDYLAPGSATIVNGRVLRCEIVFGDQVIELRDSWGLFPQALRTFGKSEIDFRCMFSGFRDVYRSTIIDYLQDDCRYLLKMVTLFADQYGDVLTVGTIAMRELLHHHPGCKNLEGEISDGTLRKYYYGGRVQFFELGNLAGQFKIYDANSMYPSVMRDFKHPISSSYSYGKTVTDKTAFVLLSCHAKGCFPKRLDDGRLDFPTGHGEYYTTAHEYRAAKALGLISRVSISHTIDFAEHTDFSAFVDDYFDRRAQAKAAGENDLDTIIKRVLNSSYGKFAIDPRRFCEYALRGEFDGPPKGALFTQTDTGIENPNGWRVSSEAHMVGEGLRIWERPTIGRLSRFLNVATAASITGAARAQLMRALAGATRPIYCDTDSVICEALGDTIKLHPKKLGAWKTELSCTRLAVAGKKLYAAGDNEKWLKTAAKGARLSGDQIARIASGEEIVWRNDAPAYSIFAPPVFVSRTLTRAKDFDDINADEIDFIE